jgi:shikimate kinase
LTRCVISTGGGLGANPAHLASLKRHALTVCLWARSEAIWRRLRHASHRPLVQGPDAEATIHRLLEVRSPVYRQADVLINTELRSLRDVTRQVLHQFRLACPVRRKP